MANRDDYDIRIQTNQAQQALSGLKKALGAVAGAFAIKELVEFSKESLAMVDAQAKLARSLDGTADGVKAVQIAAGDAGLDGLDGSLARLNRRLGAAALGNAEYAKTVKSLNLDLDELRNMDADQRVAAIADAVRDSGVASDVSSRMIQKLGFEQSNANEFFRQGGDAIRAARQEVKDYGLSLSEIDSVQVETANDAFSRITRTMEVLRQRLAVALAPIIAHVSGLLNDAAKESGGFRDAIDNAISSSISKIAFLVDAVEGIRRVFQVAGKGVALFGLGLVDVMLTAVDAIVNGPIRAINDLISVMNEIPGVEIGNVDLGDFGKSVASELKTVRIAQEIAIKDIQELLMKPMPSSGLEERLAEIKKNSREAAQQVIADRKKLEDNAPSVVAGLNIEDANKLKTDLEKSLANSRERISKSQEAVELSRFEGIERKLKEIELEELKLARIAKERVRAQFGEDASNQQLLAAMGEIDSAAQKSMRIRQDNQRSIKASEDAFKATADAETARIKRTADATAEALKVSEAAKEAAEKRSQRTFNAGWKRSFDEYADNAANASKTAERLFKQSTQGMEDAIVGFVKTGKFEFKDLIADMLETLLRSQIQQMMAGLLGGGGGSGGSAIFAGISKFAGMFANGGNIPAGQFGIAGEAGPELITGPATVTPNIGGGGGMVTYNINAVDARSFKELVARDPGFIHAVSEQGRRKAPQTRR